MQLEYFCYLNSTGYSIAAQDYILAMLKQLPSFDIRVRPLNALTNLGVSPNRQQIFSSLMNKKESAERIGFFHSIPHRYKQVAGMKKHVGFCVFETMNPPKDWVHMMNSMDCIVTASTFNQRIFEAAGVKRPIHLVPHCFDPRLFNRDVNHTGRYDLFTFIAMGTWKTRKNWEVLIKGFYDAFEVKDGVCLLLKTDKPQQLESKILQIKRSGDWRSKDTAPIFIDRSVNCNFEDIPSFMKRGDAYISTSMGEGFGYCGLHAMALGIPVITTKFGGALEYARPEFSVYLEPQHYKQHPNMDGIPQFRNCIWPVVTVSEVKQKLQYVKSHYPKTMAGLAYDFVHKTFTYEKVGPQMIAIFETLNGA